MATIKQLHDTIQAIWYATRRGEEGFTKPLRVHEDLAEPVTICETSYYRILPLICFIGYCDAYGIDPEDVCSYAEIGMLWPEGRNEHNRLLNAFSAICRAAAGNNNPDDGLRQWARKIALIDKRLELTRSSNPLEVYAEI